MHTATNVWRIMGLADRTAGARQRQSKQAHHGPVEGQRKGKMEVGILMRLGKGRG